MFVLLPFKVEENKKMDGWDIQKTRRRMDGIYRKQEDGWMGYIENKKMDGWDIQKTRRWMDGIYRKQED